MAVPNTIAGLWTLTSNSPQQWDGSFTFGGTGTLNMGTGTVTLGNSLTLTASTVNLLTIGGAIITNGNTLTVGAGNVTLGGAISGPGGLASRALAMSRSPSQILLRALRP